MVDHELSEAQELLRRSAADFLAREYPPERLRQIYGSPPGYDAEIWQRIAKLGWLGAPFPEDLGGSGGTLQDAGLILEELGRAACASPLPHALAAALALAEPRPDLVAQTIAGDALVIPATGRSVGDAVALQSSGSGMGPRVGGEIPYAPWVGQATHVMLQLPTQHGVALVALDGAQREQLDVMGGDPLLRVALDGAPAEELLGVSASQVALLGALANAQLLAGLAAGALELAVDFAKERVQFGRPIGSFQALQHKMADMAIEVEVGRNLARKAAWLHARGEPWERAARYAKAYLGDAAVHVSRQTLQIHGGVGFIDNHRAQHYYTLSTGAAGQYGTAREHRAAIADAVLGGR